jgi:hypothetical protein
MDHEVDVVEEDPAALLEPLDGLHLQSLGLEGIDDALCGGAHMGIGGAAGDEEEVGHVGHASQIEAHDVLRLGVAEGDGGAADGTEDVSGSGDHRGKLPNPLTPERFRGGSALDDPDLDLRLDVGVEPDRDLVDAERLDGLMQVDHALLDLGEALGLELLGDVARRH